MGACEAEAAAKPDERLLAMESALSSSSSSSSRTVETPDGELGRLSLSEAAAAAVAYPQRPGEPNCSYYLRTGCCSYGSKCKFNHPQDKWNWPNSLNPFEPPVQGFHFKCGGKARAMGVCEAEVAAKPDERLLTMDSALSSSSSSSRAVETPDGELGRLSLSEAAAAAYPQRPSEPNCSYFLRTGCCSYGSNCKFNHPQDKWNRPNSLNPFEPPVQAVKVNDYREFPERMLLAECKFYLMPGGCKYGKACRYGHHREKTEVKPVELNFLGLPLRPGEKECPHYMQTGLCRFSTNCWFHHPAPVNGAVGVSPSGWQDDEYSEHITRASQLPDTSSASQRNSNEPSSCLNASSPCFTPGLLLPHQVLRQNREYNCYQAPETPTPLESSQCPSVSILKCPTTEVLDPGKQQAQIKEYPQRPGEPECQFFMRYGNCKFMSACKFHHPKMRLSRLPTCDLTPLGLPLRPDQPICTFYNRFGICKYGPACKFDHPTEFGSPSASSKSSAQNSSLDNKNLKVKMPGSNALVQQPA